MWVESSLTSYSRFATISAMANAHEMRRMVPPVRPETHSGHEAHSAHPADTHAAARTRSVGEKLMLGGVIAGTASWLLGAIGVAVLAPIAFVAGTVLSLAGAAASVFGKRG